MTLREYLISLGFKIDEQAFRRFNDSVIKSSRSVAELGAETVGTATAIYASVLKVARGYEEMFYTIQRGGGTVTQLRAIEFGSRQIGVSAESARGAVEGMAAAVRNNPGLAGLLRGMGIDPNNAQSAVVGSVGKLKEQFGEGGYFAAQNMARMFGLDEVTFRQMWTNFDRLKAAEEDHKKRAADAGTETKEATDKFLEFSRAVNVLEDDLKILGDRIGMDFVDPMLKAVQVIDQVIQSVNKLDKETGGTVGVAGTIAGGAAGTWLIKRALQRMFGGLGGSAGNLIIEGEAAAGAGLSVAALRLMGPLGILLGSTVSTAGKEDDEPASAAYRNKHGGAGGGSARDHAMAYFQAQGWSREAAAGLVANLYSESKLNTGAVGDAGSAVGIGQWHSDRQRAFRRQFGKDLSQASLEEQLAFVQWELTQGNDFDARRAGSMLKNVQSAREAGALVSRYYERPANAGGEAAARGALADRFAADIAPAGGGNNVTITSKADIHVAAGPDSQSTADRVLDGQSRLTGDLVRNMVGAVR